MKNGLIENRHSRTGFAFALSLLGHMCIIGFFMVLRVCSVSDVGAMSGPMLIRIGSEIANEDMLKAAQSETVQENSGEVVPQETSANTAAKAAETQPPPSAVQSQPVNTNSGKTAQQTASQTSKASSTQASAAQPSSAQPSEQTKPAEPQVTSIKGTETGNSYEIQYLGASGEVRRSLSVPIMLYMPVPNVLPASLIDGIRDRVINGTIFATADELKKIMLKYYVRTGDTYQLKGFAQPDFTERPDIWSILEANGYDMFNAEYKMGKNLRPVQIRFTVLPPKGNEGGMLVNIKLIKSSGYSDIDEAVLFGFKQGRFSNSSNREIDAVFTYWF